MSRSTWQVAFVVSTLALALDGCGRSQPSESAATEPAVEAPGVAWFEGSADEAFALAKEVGKPLFLYWGAEWCPPCHYLKDKIFSQPDFVERSRDFIAVYLDGDEEGAQVLGEQLDVQGYPTVMVYSAEGEELLRMPSDVPVSRYAAVMERALRLDRPVSEILESVLAAGPAASDPGDLDLLAYYSWGQDSQIALEEEARLGTFARLWRETPAELAGPRARFLGLYLGEAARLARGAEEGDDPVLDDAAREEVTPALLAMLADPDLCRENVFDVTYRATSVVSLLTPEPGAERTALIEAWEQAAQRLEADEELSTDDRLTAVSTRMDLARLAAEEEDSPLPAALVDHVRERVAWAVGASKDGGEMQTLLNTAAAVLDDAGLPEEAQQLLADNLAGTEAPYYFMSWLASLKKEAGENDEAIDLYRQAWEGANGRYTRFRWGSNYLRQLMELTPERPETIEAAAREVLGELLTHGDAFALGNSLRLGQLERAFGAWNEDGEHDAVVESVRQLVSSACDGYPAEGEDSQQSRCREWLAG